VEKAARTVLATVKCFIEENPFLDEVVFVLFSERDYEVYSRSLTEL